MSYRTVLFGWIVIVSFFVTVGCTPVQTKSQGPAFSSSQDPVVFLQRYGLNVNDNPTKFSVKVPQTWEVTLGSYPEGLYWGLANTFSKDVGLDFTSLKGKNADVLVYRLTEGLPGPGQNASFKYPSNAMLLMDNNRVMGAWLSFNTVGIGPSLRKRSLADLTGLSFKQWLEREGYFQDYGGNADLAAMNPTEVLNAFFTAIEQGDKARANACLSPRDMLNSLNMNRQPGLLYNPGFDKNNSMVENIVEARPISYRYLDPDYPAAELENIGDRDRVEVAVTLYLKWADPAFNSSTGKSIRFALLEKYAIGWKLDGLGTGP